MGFHKIQYSVYQSNQTTPAATWVALFSLQLTQPVGVWATALEGVQMFHIPFATMITTAVMQLGGQNAPTALAPTPRGLFPANVPHIQMLHAPNPLPNFVRNTPAARNGANWAM